MELLEKRAEMGDRVSARKRRASKMDGMVKSLLSALWLPSPNAVVVGIAYSMVLQRLIG